MSSGHISTEIITDALKRAKQLSASNGQKRSLSDDLDFPAAKRPHTGGSNMASMGMGAPLNSDSPLVETMEIPDAAVGLIIGRSGEQINLIQQQSGCRVQMAPEAISNGMRQCTLQGPKPCIDRARQMINDVVDRNKHNLNPAYSQNAVQNTGTVTSEVFIPGPKCGLIIGKSGETIKGLQEQFGVKMLLIQESNQITASAKPLRISGPLDKVEQAKRLVEQLISSDDGSASVNQALRGSNSMPGPRSIGEVIVPRSSVGIIIGKGGETIKRLGTQSGAKIQFKPDEDPNAQERCAVIQGTPEQISHATQLISQLISGKAGIADGGQQEVFYMHVPSSKTGLVIGKGGDTIKQISNESGAHVELSHDPPPNPNEKVFVIKGTQYQIHHVQHLIRIKVGDVAPGTPLPPFTGSSGAGPLGALAAAANPYAQGHHPQFGGADHHHHQAAAAFGAGLQWPPQNGYIHGAAAAGPGAQDPSAWTQYYTQQQAASYASAAGQPSAAEYAAAAAQNAAAQHYPSMVQVGGPQAAAAAAAHQQQLHHQAAAALHQQQQQAGAGAAMAAAAAGHQQAGGVGGAGGQMGAQSGATNAAPSINPQTGQPDYSAQWAEYYRSMGMHAQAALIEQQIKQQSATMAPGGQQQQQAQQAPTGRPQQLYMQ